MRRIERLGILSVPVLVAALLAAIIFSPRLVLAQFSAESTNLQQAEPPQQINNATRGGIIYNIFDVNIIEGNSGLVSLVFTVTSDVPLSSTITFSTTNLGTATPFVDFIPLSTTVIFPPGGPVTQTVAVSVVGDFEIEGNETVFVTLSNPNPVSGFIADGNGIGTIIDDDAAICFATHDDGVTVFESANADAVQEAIDIAADGGTVRVAGTCVGTQPNFFSFSDQTAIITKSLTLIGGYTSSDWVTSDPILQPTVLDADNTGRVLFIDGFIDVTVLNLTLQNGNTAGQFSGSGGGIKAFDASVTISNTIVQSNTSDTDGGGIASDSVLTIIDSLFTGNFAGDDGGGIDPDGPAILENVEVAFNESADDGGGIDSEDTITIRNSHIHNNLANDDGGGIHTDVAELQIENSLIEANTSVEDGGGIWLDSPTALISNTDIISNSAVPGPTLFTIGGGGGIYVDSTDNQLSIVGGSVLSNVAFFGSGGGLAVITSTVTVEGTRFEGNVALEGGGIYLGASNAMISDAVIFNNLVADVGGGIASFDSTTVVSNTTVLSNTNLGIGVDFAPGLAGGIAANGTFRLINSRVAENRTDGFDDFAGGGMFVSPGSTAYITGSEISSNSAISGFGGGILNAGRIEMFETTISNNTALDGGAIENDDIGIGIGPIFPDPGGPGDCPPFCFPRSATADSNVKREKTVAESKGRWRTADVPLELNNVDPMDTLGALIIQSSVLSGNTAIGFGGGAIYNFLGSMLISDTKILSNTSNGFGGGLVSEDGVTTIIHSDISGNSAITSGGAIDIFSGTVTLDRSLVSFNSATTAGGINMVSAELNIRNSTISNNFALGPGGGLIVEGGMLNLNNVTINENISLAFGGGLFDAGSIVETANSIFANNIGDDCDATPTSLGNNLDSDGTCEFVGGTDISATDPELGPLADNGGRTKTHALLSTSPALDTGNNATCEAVDQRDVTRPQGATCDRGAYEAAQVLLELDKAVDKTELIAGDRLTYTIIVANTGILTATGVVISDNLPANTTFVSVALTPAQAGATVAAGAGDLPVLASGVTITPSESVMLTFVVDSLSTYSGTITNTATISEINELLSPTSSVSDTVTSTAYTVEYSINDAAIVEGDSGTTALTFVVSRTNVPVASEIAVSTADDTATAGSDYTALTGETVQFAAGASSQTVTVQGTGETLTELDETFDIGLLPPALGSIGTMTATGTITNDDSVTIGINDVTITEGDSGTTDAVFTVTMTSTTDVELIIPALFPALSATFGVDFNVPSPVVTFPAGIAGTQTLTATVTGEEVVELDETFLIALLPPMAFGRDVTITRDVGTGTILNDDAATISIDAVTVAEGDAGTQQFEFTVSLDAEVDTEVMVDFETAADSATAGVDYVEISGTLTLSGTLGDTQTVSVTVNGDEIVEADELFIVDLSAIVAGGRDVTFADSQGVGTIENDDSATFVISDTVVLEGDSGTSDLVFTVTLDAEVQGGVSVDFAVSDDTATLADNDYQPLAPGTLNFVGTAGEQQSFTVLVNGDTTVEAVESLNATLSNSTNADVTIADGEAVGIIPNDDAALILIDNVTVDEGVSTAVLTVTLINPLSYDADVFYTTADNTAVDGDDYTRTVLNSFMISAGMTQTQILVPIIDDTLVEETESFTVTINTFDATVIMMDASVTILDNDVATLSIADVTVDESVGMAVLTVTQSAETSIDTTFTYSTTDNTATATNDFNFVFNSATIPAGSLETTIMVPIIDDILDENTETFTMTIGSVVGLPTVADSAATVTILDNDTAELSINDATINEGDGFAVLTVTLSTPSINDVVVDFATADGTAIVPMDYISFTSQYTIPSGMTEFLVIVTVIDDAVVESTEDLSVTISSADAPVTDNTGVVTILDNDTADLVVSDVLVFEADGTAVVSVTQSLVSTSDTVITYSTVDDTAVAPSDYMSATGQVTITAGMTETAFTITIVDDAELEFVEWFTATIASTDATVIDANGTITIIDNDTATISIGDVMIDEGAGVAVLTVTQSSPAPTDTTFDYTTADGTATATNDFNFVLDSATIPAGMTEITVTVPIIDDNLDENTEVFSVTLSNLNAFPSVSFADDTGQVTILDNDTAELSISDATINEGDGFAVLTVTLSTPSINNVVVDFATMDGTAIAAMDYISFTSQYTIPAGMTEFLIIVTVIDDAVVESTEDLSVTISSADAPVTDDTGVVTILDNDMADLVVSDVLAFEGNGTAVVSVTQSLISTSDTVVTYSTVDGTAVAPSDYLSATGQVTITAGMTETAFTITIVNDTELEFVESFTATIASADANVTDANGTITIIDNDSATISIGDVTVNEDAGVAVLTVVQSSAAPVDSMFTYTTVDGSAQATNDFNPVFDNATIPAGMTEITLTVAIIDDLLDENTETFSVTLASLNAFPSVSFADDTAQVTILDNDSAELSINDATINEDAGFAVLTVTLSTPAARDVVVDFASVDGTATDTMDYVGVTGQFTMTTGVTEWLIVVPITDDLFVENTEAFSVTISSLDAPVTDDTGAVTILDNDVAAITIADVTVDESVGTAVVTVTLLNPLSYDADVFYTTTDITAEDGSDYTGAVLDSFMIAAGMTEATILVPIIDDVLVEQTESFSVTIDTFDAVIVMMSGEVTIIDNDAATVSIGDVTVDEDAGMAVLTVVQSAETSIDTTFTFTTTDNTAIAPDDYANAVDTATIPAGTLQTTIMVPIVDDLLVENSESLTVTIGSVVGLPTVADGAGAITILDNDVTNVSIADVVVDEVAGTAVVTVTQSAVSVADTVVTFNTADGTAIDGLDYTAASGQLTITAGMTQTFISVPIIDDLLNENAETFDVQIAAMSSLSVTVVDDTGVVTILDNDAEPFIDAVTPVFVQEGTAQAVVTLTLSAVSALDVGVDYRTVDASAIVGQDYVSATGRITFTAGVTVVTFTVDIIDDAFAEFLETFDVVLSNPSNASIAPRGVTPVFLRVDTVQVRIADNDIAGINALPATHVISEGMTTVFTPTLDTPPQAPVTLRMTSSDPSTCALNPTEVTLDASNYMTGVPVVVTGIDDLNPQGPDRMCTITFEVVTTDLPYLEVPTPEVMVEVLNIPPTAVGLLPTAQATGSAVQVATVWIGLLMLSGLTLFAERRKTR